MPQTREHILLSRRVGIPCMVIYMNKVAPIAPIAMEDGLRFAIREGGRTVGAGVVSKIIA